MSRREERGRAGAGDGEKQRTKEGLKTSNPKPTLLFILTNTQEEETE